nr:hypothetical protein [Microvirga sp. Mcv34]
MGGRAARESRNVGSRIISSAGPELASGRAHAAIQDLGAAFAAIPAAVARQHPLGDDRAAVRA